jgi:DNA-binding NarL/FixJ family response regulator
MTRARERRRLPAVEQELGFATAADGTRIGYAVSGEGRPLLYIAIPAVSHALLWAEQPMYESDRELLRPGRQFVWVDLRGSGVSSKDVKDYSLDVLAGDLTAVADALGIAEFDICARGVRAPIAVHLAATQPHRVRRLVLWRPVLRDAGWQSGTRPLRMGSDFDKYLRHLARTLYSQYPDNEVVAFSRQCVNQADLNACLDAFIEYGVRESMADVICPTLALLLPGSLFADEAAMAEVIGRMPLSEVVVVGSMHDRAALDRAARMTAEFLDRPMVRPVNAGPVDARVPPSEMAAKYGERLTPREVQVVMLLAEGLTNAQIAAKLSVTLATVATHVRHVLEKTGSANRAEASAWAVRNRLV